MTLPSMGDWHGDLALALANAYLGKKTKKNYLTS